jgi:hypothetical protein
MPPFWSICSCSATLARRRHGYLLKRQHLQSFRTHFSEVARNAVRHVPVHFEQFWGHFGRHACRSSYVLSERTRFCWVSASFVTSEPRTATNADLEHVWQHEEQKWVRGTSPVKGCTRDSWTCRFALVEVIKHSLNQVFPTFKVSLVTVGF